MRNRFSSFFQQDNEQKYEEDRIGKKIHMIAEQQSPELNPMELGWVRQDELDREIKMTVDIF